MQQFHRTICNYLILLSISLSQYNQVIAGDVFNVYYQWSFINFTWLSEEAYQSAINSGNYIPQNNALGGLKSYNDKIYYALPRVRDGTPVTLASSPRQDSAGTNILLSPYPSWEMNAQLSCDTLQNVQSMEIDRQGIMWVIDGIRINSKTSCPPKLVLLDLNNEGNVILSYTFTNDVVLHEGGFMNDIVVDESDGGYAYITDNGNIDPGLIIYSRRLNKAWKLRDATMFPEKNATAISSGGLTMEILAPIDGIALSPSNQTDRFIYYCPLSGYNLYQINTNVVKNEELYKNGQWRNNVTLVGTKQSQSDGLIVDNQGNLYYTLLQINSIGKWNTNEKWSDNSATIIYKNQEELVWPDSFAFDSSGYLIVLASNMNKFMNPTYTLTMDGQMKIRLFRMYTGNQNYMY